MPERSCGGSRHKMTYTDSRAAKAIRFSLPCFVYGNRLCHQRKTLLLNLPNGEFLMERGNRFLPVFITGIMELFKEEFSGKNGKKK